MAHAFQITWQVDAKADVFASDQADIMQETLHVADAKHCTSLTTIPCGKRRYILKHYRGFSIPEDCPHLAR